MRTKFIVFFIRKTALFARPLFYGIRFDITERPSAFSTKSTVDGIFRAAIRAIRFRFVYFEL